MKLIFVRGTEVDLVSVWRAKLPTCFFLCRPKMTCLQCRDRLTWFFVWVVEFD